MITEMSSSHLTRLKGSSFMLKIISDLEDTVLLFKTPEDEH